MITARGLEGKARRELDATRSSEKVLAEEKMGNGVTVLDVGREI